MNERVFVRKTERGPWEVWVDGQMVSTHTSHEAARIVAQRHFDLLVDLSRPRDNR